MNGSAHDASRFKNVTFKMYVTNKNKTIRKVIRKYNKLKLTGDNNFSNTYKKSINDNKNKIKENKRKTYMCP